MNPLSGFRSGGANEDQYDGWDEFVPANVPEPGPFLEDYRVLEDEDHVAVHECARELFEERGVYDATFGYNLAKLNLDRRHPDAGFRYALEDDGVLRAEFTPTTEFCPQADALLKGAFRAWNDRDGDREYDLIRVRVRPSHNQTGSINDALEAAERRFRETRTVEFEPEHPQ
ncbi:hypothetical protein [Natronococcus jeotgali]|uniref:DUF7998 domain-containing protein n=1 Tax=Natronococcus jeotgali DSM 18795 TaxID=1227498 RepID=L9XG45_9EURY|nr:hypothetical protein [Natronococcus jeotgali]ELY60704.1 hypothetical protein C492_10460 [Natronococcus jeotgali DSM 18795]